MSGVALGTLLCAAQATAREKIIVLDEGTWQSDNGRLTYFENGAIVSNQWFRDVNGTKLGDTPNDIIQINDNLLAIAVNWSNVIQFITPEGKAAGATEDVPNNRCLASDGKYVYVTSYAHTCGTAHGTMDFEKGFVAKIDVSDFKVTDAVEVGYEPEGIALYDGHLFVANSGGYAFQEDHDYGTTVSVIDAASMKVTRTVDTGRINLLTMSKSGQYLCIYSAGDYYNAGPCTIIMDCDAVLAGKPDADCFVTLDLASTHSCTAADGNFYAMGSGYSYVSGGYEFNYNTIDPAKVLASGGKEGTGTVFPGTVKADIAKMTMPYSIYVNPYTGYIYATDAGEYTAAGALYQWTPDGRLTGTFRTYINPGHILALPPDGHFDGIGDAVTDSRRPADSRIFNLQGIEVSNPQPGEIYISGGRKFIYREY